MLRKNLFITLLLLAVMVILAACGGGSSEDNKTASGSAESNGDVRTLRISLGLNDQHPLYKGSEKFKELVESQTDSLKVEIYHSGQIADDRSAIEMLQFGTLDITIPSSAPFVSFVPEYGVFDLPFTLTDTEMVDAVLQGEFGETLASKVESQGIVQLAWWENGFRQLTNNSKPINKLEDLDGLKIRVMENETHIASWKALGTNPTPMAFTELFTAMQQKTVDGQENPYPSILLEKYPEVQKYLTETNHVYSPFLFLFSKKVWDELTPEEQEIIRNAAVEAGEYNRELTRQTATESLEELKKQMEFTKISDEELVKFKEAVQPVIDEYKSQIDSEIVDQYLSEIEKHSK
ncbi:TRAP transporter substrate-binding protein [Ureibacillus sinduriensis]|uniref:ABC transporter substrate-binding protein n=1 Tax=Ureibacillus sinduriensis BLB-1 = JCM 15800 TaxID=1384057 RepID=A0A0A3I5H4_9BACL|nr:TRAP transporter substrate-binding protein [Ureibacillus sinduriensis]KGR77933.1 ABC transporter substrate-binding protein [Ureibacillus sinduriensis BLB-1 = JCM 15800]